MQVTYNVTLRRVRVSIVVVEKHYIGLLNIIGVYLLLVLVIQQANRIVSAPCYVDICDVSASTLLCYIIS